MRFLSKQPLDIKITLMHNPSLSKDITSYGLWLWCWYHTSMAFMLLMTFGKCFVEREGGNVDHGYHQIIADCHPFPKSVPYVQIYKHCTG